MPRPVGSAPPEAIRIEDEVWQEAFARREPAKPRRLQAIAGGRTSPAPTVVPRVARRTTAPAAPAPIAGPRKIAEPAARTAAARRQRERPTAAPVLTPKPVSAAVELPAWPRGGWQEGPSPDAVGGVPGRRTVTIRGHGAERNLPWPDASRRRPERRAYERTGFRPDRVAMWAVLLGILLVIVAVASAHG